MESTLSMCGAGSSTGMRAVTQGRMFGRMSTAGSCGCNFCGCVHQPQGGMGISISQPSAAFPRLTLIREQNAGYPSRKWQPASAVLQEQSVPAAYDVQSQIELDFQLPVTHQTASSICEVLAEKSVWGPECVQELLSLGVSFNSYVVMLALKEMKSADMAWQFFQWVAEQEGFQHNVNTYATMIESFGRAKNVTAIPAVLEHMDAARVKRNVVVCTSLITAYGRAKNLDESLRVFERMDDDPGCKPNVITYTALMDLLSKVGRHDDAGKVYAKMVEAGCRPSAHTYTVLIHSLGQAGKLEKAEEVFNRMSQAGCTPTSITYSALINAHAKAGNADKALQCLRRMKAANLGPPTSAYQMVASALTKAGRSHEADALWTELPRKQAKAKAKVEGQAKSKEVKDQQDKQTPSSEDKQDDVLTVDVPSEQGNGQQAVVELKDFHEKSPDSGNGNTRSRAKHTYVQVGGNMIKLRTGERVSAESIAKIVANWGPSATKVLEYIGIRKKKPEFVVEVLKRVKDPEAALNFFAWLRADEDFPVNAFLYNKLIDVVGQARDMEKVEELLNEMKSTGIEISVVTLNTIIFSYIKAQYLEGALQVFEQMKEYDCEPNVVTYTCFINAYCKIGDYEKAMTMYRTMLDAGCTPNNHTYCAVLKVLGYTGKLEDARDLLRRMPSLGVRPDAFSFTAVIMAFKEAGNLDMALEVYKEMQESGIEMKRLSALVVEDLLKTVGREEEAKQLREAMKLHVTLDPVVRDIVTDHFSYKKATKV